MTPSFNPQIESLAASDVQSWMEAHLAYRGETHLRRLSQIWHEAQLGARLILVAWDKSGDAPRLLGHVTLLWQSAYPPFARGNIPEIVDLWVVPTERRRGVAAALLHHAEMAARTHGATRLGLGVGVLGRFGPAHCLYHALGFRPDGTGLWVQGVNIRDDATVLLNDEALLMWVKAL